MATEFQIEGYVSELLPDFLHLVSENARIKWPAASSLLTSDVAWRLPGSYPEKNLSFWYLDDELVGYAWFDANGPCIIDQKSSMGWAPELGAQMISWLEARRQSIKPLHPWLIDLENMAEWEHALTEGRHLAEGEDRYLQIAVFDSESSKQVFLEKAGFSPTRNFQYYLARSLEDQLPPQTLDINWTLRHVIPEDVENRVTLHRSSWFKSTYQMQDYLALRDISVYDPELDLVAVAKNGSFGSYCIGWVDYKTGVGSFEPVGTPPEFRRKGLGREVNLEGLRRMKAKGMHSAKIGTAGFNDRAYALYLSCGFNLVDKHRTFIKKLN